MFLNLKDKTGTITLNSGHALILGNKPEKLSMDQIAEKLSIEKQDTVNLGLFDTAAPNYSTYYPEVTADDLNPKDGDFIYPVFRLLSETILSKHGRPIDFSKKGVLKKSMNMLVGQTINIDHETALGNAIGAVKEVKWQNSYSTADGKVIPGGINGLMKIDGKSNPRIARGIMMDPPSIHSNSVSVRFKWEKSHSFENDDEFFNKLGEKGADGELIRVVVSDILQYTETSLVGHGADPFAQKVDQSGQIVNPEYAVRNMTFSADNGKDHLNFDYKTLGLSLSEDTTIPKNINIKDTNNKTDSMDFKEFLKGFTNFDLGEDVTEENFAGLIQTKFQEQLDLVTNLTTENSNLKTSLADKDAEVVRLNGTIESNKLMTELGVTALSNVRSEAERFYKLIKKEGDQKQSILDNITNADFTLASSLLEEYKSEAEKLFPDTCQDCNSTNVSKASAFKSGEDEKETTKVKSNVAVLDELKAKNKKQSIALGK